MISHFQHLERHDAEFRPQTRHAFVSARPQVTGAGRIDAADLRVPQLRPSLTLRDGLGGAAPRGTDAPVAPSGPTGAASGRCTQRPRHPHQPAHPQPPTPCRIRRVLQRRSTRSPLRRQPSADADRRDHRSGLEHAKGARRPVSRVARGRSAAAVRAALGLPGLAVSSTRMRQPSRKLTRPRREAPSRVHRTTPQAAVGQRRSARSPESRLLGGSAQTRTTLHSNGRGRLARTPATLLLR
jgi:hypothetical protein